MGTCYLDQAAHRFVRPRTLCDILLLACFGALVAWTVLSLASDTIHKMILEQSELDVDAMPYAFLQAMYSFRFPHNFFAISSALSR